MKYIKYDLDNKKLNNDLRQYLSSNEYKWEYFKDYSLRVRIVILLNKDFDKIDFENFVKEKRRNKNWESLSGLF